MLPTIYARDGERILVHGSSASRTLRNLRSGISACATVTLIDGLVLARSAYHHSMNYRSVVILGTATEICDRAGKLAAMRTIVNHVVPGRWDDVRAPSEAEIRATTVLSLPLNEASAKVQTGPPLDDEEDYALMTWAEYYRSALRLMLQKPIRDCPAVFMHHRTCAFTEAGRFLVQCIRSSYSFSRAGCPCRAADASRKRLFMQRR